MKLLSCLFFVFLLINSAYAHDVESASDRINVLGVGEVSAAPDQAFLNISINAKQPNLVDAKKLADQRYQQVLKVINDADIDKRQVKATRLNAQPQYEWHNGQRRYKGEQVSRSLTITVNDLDKVSPLMQALIENGVSTIDGMSTGFKDKTALRQQALAIAADDARNKAKFLAERLGRNLGDAFLITEQHNQSPPEFHPQVRMAAEMSTMKARSAPPEMFGEQKVTAKVNVSFNLL